MVKSCTKYEQDPWNIVALKRYWIGTQTPFYIQKISKCHRILEDKHRDPILNRIHVHTEPNGRIWTRSFQYCGTGSRTDGKHRVRQWIEYKIDDCFWVKCKKLTFEDFFLKIVQIFFSMDHMGFFYSTCFLETVFNTQKDKTRPSSTKSIIIPQTNMLDTGDRIPIQH